MYTMLVPLSNKDTSPDPNTDVSLPAGSIADDGYELRFTYTPTGDMSGGAFELRIPTGWTVADDAVDAVWEGNAVRGEVTNSSGVLTFTLTDTFGQSSQRYARDLLS